MRAVLAVALLLTLSFGASADLGDFDTSLREIAFDEVQVSPDEGRVWVGVTDTDSGALEVGEPKSRR